MPAVRTRRARFWTAKAIPFGLLILLLGAWAFAAPLAGGYFNFGFTSDATWQFSAEQWELHIVPGLAAAAGGLMLMTPARGWGRLGGLLAFLGGAWLVTGWAFYPVWADGTVEPHGSAFMQGIRWLGQVLGPGGLILLFAGWTQGLLFMRRQTIVEEIPPLFPPTAASVEPPPVDAAPETAPVEPSPLETTQLETTQLSPE